MSLKKWNISKPNKEKIAIMSDIYNIPAILAMLLQIRKISDNEIEDILFSDYELEDPFNFIDMDKAVVRIKQSIENFEKICIYGDYDADGVTATSLMYLYLENCGANVTYYIPNRKNEGYGLNIKAIDKLKSDGVSLILTVDNGISAINEVKYALNLGIDTVITDHHQVPEIMPEAVAIVDPHRKDCNSIFKNLAGVGVAFFLILALEGQDIDPEFLLESYSDLILIGTIGDIVPLNGTNRFFVKKGLEYILNTDKLGINAILEKTSLQNKELTSENIAFGIVPRINAAGRISRADKIVKLFTSDNFDEILDLATEIEKENAKRKEIEEEIFNQAQELLTKEPSRLFEKIIIVEGQGWNAGVIGIVSSRITEKYGKPSIVIAMDEETAKASGRSIDGFSLYSAINNCSSYLLRFGGHPMAAGFEIKNEDINKFKKDITLFTKQFGRMPSATLNIDCKLNPAALSLAIIDQIKMLEPFGKDNPSPIFALCKLRIDNISPIGNGKHLRLTFTKDNQKITALKFSTTLQNFEFKVGDIVDIAVNLHSSNYNNIESLSIFIKDIKMSDIDVDDFIEHTCLYEAFCRGEFLEIENLDEILPSKEDFSNFYRYLRSEKEIKSSIYTLCYRIRHLKINLFKLFIILDVFSEFNLINFKKEVYFYTVNLNQVTNKVNLEDSMILKKLKERGI